MELGNREIVSAFTLENQEIRPFSFPAQSLGLAWSMLWDLEQVSLHLSGPQRFMVGSTFLKALSALWGRKCFIKIKVTVAGL